MIQLTAQQLATDLKGFIKQGVLFNACSLRQLEAYGALFPGTDISIRFNPGMGSGANSKTDVGGHHSSFGIWVEKIPEVMQIVRKHNLTVSKVHTHIGSGSDPAVWERVAKVTLGVAEQFPSCMCVNLGGGFKVARMADEKSTILEAIGQPVKQLFSEFFQKTGRRLHLEIEPGSFYLVNSGAIICRIDDTVDTGAAGFKFLKLNTGMDAITRPSLYGARHPIVIVPADPERRRVPILERPVQEYVVVGHCCETGDMLTQSLGGEHQTRLIHQASLDDFVVIEGTGAYCSSMCTKNYNSFPELAELLLKKDGSFMLIRKQQSMDQILSNEL
jgi:diaminopimelate decarboxylase